MMDEAFDPLKAAVDLLENEKLKNADLRAQLATLQRERDELKLVADDAREMFAVERERTLAGGDVPLTNAQIELVRKMERTDHLPTQVIAARKLVQQLVATIDLRTAERDELRERCERAERVCEVVARGTESNWHVREVRELRSALAAYRSTAAKEGK